MKPDLKPSWHWRPSLRHLTVCGLLLLWFSGIVLYGMDPTGPGWQEELAFQWRHPALMIHAAATWLMLWMSGRVITGHASGHLKRASMHRRGVLGVIGGLALLILALSGWLLMYGHADWHEPTSGIHFWLGLFALPVWCLHIQHLR